MSMAARISILACVAAAFVLPSCYQVPVTGRSAINAVDDASVVKQSIAQFEELKKTYRVSRDKTLNERVQRVGDRLSKVAFWDIPNADWEFVVFDVPNQINAFAMPGGKVGVFSGLFAIIENDDQLASVLAHEIAHVAAKHTHERLTQAMGVEAGGLLLGGALMNSGAGMLSASAIQSLYGLSANGAVLAYDRKKEKEADHIGMIYMARAGYDPRESVKVLENLEAKTGAEAGGWLSTHPSNPERIVQLMDLMPEAESTYRQSGLKQKPILIK